MRNALAVPLMVLLAPTQVPDADATVVTFGISAPGRIDPTKSMVVSPTVETEAGGAFTFPHIQKAVFAYPGYSGDISILAR